MTHGLSGRILGIFVGALCGYIVGWALGWSLFDPNLDVWALTSLIGALLGLILGLRSGFWKRAGVFAGSALGVYLGWILRTLLFGDVPGGVGFLLILGGAITGAMVGRHQMFQQDGPALRALVLGLVAGYFGGFFIDWIAMEVAGIVSEEPPILVHAPAITVAGLVGGACGALSARRKRSTP